MYTKSVSATNFGPLGEIGAYLSLQLSRKNNLLKLIVKKLSLKINVKNIKKIELINDVYFTLHRRWQNNDAFRPKMRTCGHLLGKGWPLGSRL